MRMGDLEQLKEEILWGNVYLSEKEIGALVDAVDNQPTIAPESLPVVQQLREELEEVKAERDAAVDRVKHYAGCWECELREKGECEVAFSNSRCKNWKWRGAQIAKHN